MEGDAAALLAGSVGQPRNRNGQRAAARFSDARRAGRGNAEALMSGRSIWPMMPVCW
jgi:hypothetical protein